MRVLSILLLLLPVLLQAQHLTVNRIELNGGDVIFHYSLSDTTPGRSFMVNLYASRDNYINPLTALSGDFGTEVKAGNDKQVTWHAGRELGSSFDGKISVEVRARVYVPFILFDDFSKIKRGKPHDVTWRGGTRQSTLNFELYNKKDEKVTTIPNINAAAGHTSLYIPTDVKTGSGYRFKIVDSKNKDQVVYTGRFTIKRKIPLVLVAAPVAILGGVVALTGGGEGGGGGPGEIPDPKDPPQ